MTWVPLGCYVGAPAGLPQIASIPLFAVVSWWALQDSNLRPLPCERPRRGWQGLHTSGKLLQSRRTHIDSPLYGSAGFGRVWTGACCILAARPVALTDGAQSRRRA